MSKSIYDLKRKNYIEIGEIFFWTATINKWQQLLQQDKYKDVIISSLQYLHDLSKADIFAFVIMPNHIHLIWRITGMNGKETVQGSFLKYTAHEFKKILKDDRYNDLSSYTVNASNKNYEFWQRDSLAVHLYTKRIAYQKLDYIHANPCVGHWRLVNDPADYVYSSAKYYMIGEKHYPFLKDIRDEF